MSWIWSLVGTTAFQVGGYSHGGLGRCAGLVQSLLAGNCDSLLKVLRWSAVLQGWSRPQRQHDVGAFACHALAKLRNELMVGHWIARRADPVSRDLDTGPQHQPITIPIPDGASTLQECVEAWHRQHALHALGAASPLLLLQLGRFRHRSHRHVTKYRGILLLQGVVHMPCFNDVHQGLDVHTIPYKVIAGVFHLGATPAAGHYRAFLSEAEGVGGNQGVPQCILQSAFETDDNRTPRKLDPTEYDTILSNMYLVWLLKLPPEHS